MNSQKFYIFQQSSPIHLVTETEQSVEISIHQPSTFISQNLQRVLPDWTLPVIWVVIVLQQTQYELVETTPYVEREKDCLREKFMRFGFEFALKLRDRGFLADLIDPRSGYPLLSRPGEISHDDTAVVRALLGFPVINNNCCVLKHPRWGTAVYPSTMLSSASPTIIQATLKSVAFPYGWREPKTNLQLSYFGI